MRVHVVGAGPVGLLLTALLQSMEGLSVRLYEKRHEYTRTRMVQLAPYLVADSVESYRIDSIDGDSVEAVFDPAELDQGRGTGHVQRTAAVVASSTEEALLIGRRSSEVRCDLGLRSLGVVLKMCLAA